MSHDAAELYSSIRFAIGSQYVTITDIPWVISPVYRVALTDRALKVSRQLYNLLDGIDFSLPQDWPEYRWRGPSTAEIGLAAMSEHNNPLFMRNKHRLRLSLPPLQEDSIQYQQRGRRLPLLTAAELHLVCSDLDVFITSLRAAKAALDGMRSRSTRSRDLASRTSKAITLASKLRDAVEKLNDSDE